MQMFAYACNSGTTRSIKKVIIIGVVTVAVEGPHVEWSTKELRAKTINQFVWGSQLPDADIRVEAHILHHPDSSFEETTKTDADRVMVRSTWRSRYLHPQPE